MEINVKVSSDELGAYLRYSQEIYRANAADFETAREIIREWRELHPDDADTLVSLEGNIAVWASENAEIRNMMMTEFAEAALAIAQDHEATMLGEEVAAVCRMDDKELRETIAARAEKIKYQKRMRENHHDE